MSACGFEPLLTRAPEGAQALQAALQDIAITATPGRAARDVEVHLLRQISPAGAPGAAARWQLDITVQARQDDLLIQETTEITRRNYVLSADFRLREQATNRIVLDGQSQATAAYNLARSEFANLSAQRNAERRAAKAVADDVELRLALFFAAPPDDARGGGAGPP